MNLKNVFPFFLGDFVLLNVEEDNKIKTKESCKIMKKIRKSKIWKQLVIIQREKVKVAWWLWRKYKNDKQGKIHKR